MATPYKPKANVRWIRSTSSHAGRLRPLLPGLSRIMRRCHPCCASPYRYSLSYSVLPHFPRHPLPTSSRSRSDSPTTRNEIPQITPTNTRHTMRQVHPRTDQTRTRRHRQSHLSNEDQEGYTHARAGRIAHKDDIGRGDGGVRGVWRWGEEVEVCGEGVQETAWLFVSLLMRRGRAPRLCETQRRGTAVWRRHAT